MNLYFGIILAFISIALFAIIVRIWSSSRGKLIITIPQGSIYGPGEIIKGSVIVDLKKVIHASKLEITLWAETKVIQDPAPDMALLTGVKKIQNPTQMNTVNQTPQPRIIRIYEFTLSIAGEGGYLKGEYPFEILVPVDDSIVDEVSDGLKIAKQVLSLWQRPNPIQWHLMASLDIPGALDLSNSIQIQVGANTGVIKNLQ